MEYRPLDVEKDEIRLLKILPRRPDDLKVQAEAQREGLIYCTLEHVSLNEFTEDSKNYIRSPGKDVFTLEAFLAQALDDHRKTGDQFQRSSGNPTTVAETDEGLHIMRKTITSTPRWARWKWGDYLALSYMWGSWDNPQTIILNGHEMKVTENLHDFLETVQRTPGMTSGCGIWIDALCINQKDIAERNAQVKRMTTIYEQAFATIGWLGKEDEHTDKAIELIKMLSSRQLASTSGGDHTSLRDFELHHFPSGSWVALHNYFNRPYWSRLWVIQEIALSSSRLYVMCGDATISWGEIMSAIDLFKADMSPLFQLFEEDFKDAGLDAPENHAFLGVNRLEQLSPFSQRSSENARAGSGLTPGELLTIVRASEQTDPKDKVYGIMSLLPPDIAQAITPDYNQSLQQVFRAFVVACVTVDESLDIICQSRSPDLSTDNWPSWVPDLRLEPSINIDFIRVQAYGASGDTLPTMEFQNETCLRAQGFRIGVVDGLGHGFSFPMEIDLPEYTHFEKTMLEGAPITQPTHSNGENPYHHEAGLREALWRTLVTNCSDTGTVAPDAFESILHIPLTLAGMPENQEHLLPLANSRMFLLFTLFRFCNQKLKIGGQELLSYSHFQRRIMSFLRLTW